MQSAFPNRLAIKQRLIRFSRLFLAHGIITMMMPWQRFGTKYVLPRSKRTGYKRKIVLIFNFYTSKKIWWQHLIWTSLFSLIWSIFTFQCFFKSWIVLHLFYLKKLTSDASKGEKNKGWISRLLVSTAINKMDTTREPLILEATALPTEPQPML